MENDCQTALVQIVVIKVKLYFFVHKIPLWNTNVLQAQKFAYFFATTVIFVIGLFRLQAVVGSIVWAFRRLRKPRSWKMSSCSYVLHSVCPQLSLFLFRRKRRERTACPLWCQISIVKRAASPNHRSASSIISSTTCTMPGMVSAPSPNSSWLQPRYLKKN